MRNVIIMRFYEVSFIFLLVLLEGITIFGKKNQSTNWQLYGLGFIQIVGLSKAIIKRLIDVKHD